MKIINYEELIKVGKQNNYQFNITVGFFDGLHLGHQALIEMVKSTDSKIKSVVITFDQKVRPVEEIFPLSEKIHILEKKKIDFLLILKMKEVMPIKVPKVLEYLNKIKINKLIVGENFRFGYQGLGTYKDLKRAGINVIVAPTYRAPDGIIISSSQIRENLQQGKIDTVRELLGFNYYLRGIIVKGQQLGRTINFPTANLKTEFFLPKIGVYQTKSKINGKYYSSLTNIGIRPTVNHNLDLTVETYINHQFDSEFYGEEIKVEFISFIREEIKFTSIEELTEQLAQDLQIIKK